MSLLPFFLIRRSKMGIETQLYEGNLIRLGPIDYEKDPEVESRWTHDISYLRTLGQDLARPLSPAQMKKKYERIEKQVDESKNTFYFTIRLKEDDRLLGFVQLFWIEFNHGNGNMRMGIGDPQDRGKGYGSEALRLILHYSFDELNLYRLGALLGEDNPGGLRFFQKFGFVEEVRRRQALQRDGRSWDLLHLGLLADEWRQNRQREVGS
jgi:RimJ/RimL family protein N-acetyltransferase